MNWCIMFDFAKCLLALPTRIESHASVLYACVSVGAPSLCDRDLSGRGVYLGSRGTSGEPGIIHGDA